MLRIVVELETLRYGQLLIDPGQGLLLLGLPQCLEQMGKRLLEQMGKRLLKQNVGVIEEHLANLSEL